MTVIAEFDAGISEATMHALADEILKYRRAVRLLAKAVGWADVGAPFAPDRPRSSFASEAHDRWCRLRRWLPGPADPLPTMARGYPLGLPDGESARASRAAIYQEPAAAHAPRTAMLPRRRAWLRIFVVRCGLPL